MSESDFDAVIVGAGFGGMYALFRLRGLGFKTVVVEAGDGVGGTWYWNRYPGARCDVESMEYSYSFSDELQQEWDWTERYASQPEILRYANYVADRFDLRRDIRFSTRVTGATFDDALGRWSIHTHDGQIISATFCIMATGCLSAANTPDIKGIGDFAGDVYHTGRWPHGEVVFTGCRVGVIGTGSSAIQSIPLIARQAAHLFVFQRTPNYSVPAHNSPLDPKVRARIKAEYADLRANARRMPTAIYFLRNDKSALEVSEEERQREYEARWANGGFAFVGAFRDVMLDPRANETAAEFVRNKIRSIVHDPEVAGLLCPRGIFGGKRACVDSDYFATFNRPNVTLVDISESPIEEITPQGVRVEGTEYAIDALIFATGFDAMTGALLRMDIRGRGGVGLRDKWRDGPRTYLGLAVADFPNLFILTGPGSPSVLSNMFMAIEQHVDWVAACLEHLRARGVRLIEVDSHSESAWIAHADEVASRSLRSKANSWYVGANIQGKPRVFMPYLGPFPDYVRKCEEVAANGYEGFLLSTNA